LYQVFNLHSEKNYVGDCARGITLGEEQRQPAMGQKARIQKNGIAKETAGRIYQFSP
jgi:hypothetical protein